MTSYFLESLKKENTRRIKYTEVVHVLSVSKAFSFLLVFAVGFRETIQ